MTDGNTHAIAQHLDEREDWDALQEVTAELEQAEARIEELEAELHLMKTAGIIEVAIRNPNVSEYMAHWERRAEGAEAKLAKAVEVADKSIKWLRLYGADVHREAAALAELKGQE